MVDGGEKKALIWNSEMGGGVGWMEGVRVEERVGQGRENVWDSMFLTKGNEVDRGLGRGRLGRGRFGG